MLVDHSSPACAASADSSNTPGCTLLASLDANDLLLPSGGSVAVALAVPATPALVGPGPSWHRRPGNRRQRGSAPSTGLRSPRFLGFAQLSQGLAITIN
jgi:hypothetical protein